MYPSRFRYAAPRTLDEAIALLAEHGDDAKVLAGGQSLVPLLKLRFAAPALLVDINNLPGLDHHREDGDGTLRVGALCRHADLERSTVLPGRHPLMASAAPLVADPIVRNRGTLVGSVCHADPQGDWAAVMIALGGLIVARGPAGRRTIRRPASSRPVPERAATARSRWKRSCRPPRPASASYLKLERRVGDFATAGVAVALDMTRRW
jgi:carbon-monoxide dehydrogenase medium subunit